MPICSYHWKLHISRTLTGWLKVKYPTGQNAISRHPSEIFIPKLFYLYGRDPATILNFFKIIVDFSKVMVIWIIHAIVFSGSSICCSTGRCTCIHGNAVSRLNCYQLQWIHCQIWMVSELAWRLPSGLTYLGSYAWMLQFISTQSGEHPWAEESSAVDMGPAATGLNQQSHIVVREKTSGLCETWWWTVVVVYHNT